MVQERRTYRIGNRVTVSTTRKVPDKLSVERIVGTAVAQLREHGYDAVTMRSIAKALGTGPASLYAHVANREELDQLVVGRVAAQWQIPDPDPARWGQQVKEAFTGLLAIYRENPGVARCSMGMIPMDVEAMRVMERFVALLRAGGVADQHIAWFVDVSMLFVGSVAMEEDIWRERARQVDPGGDADELEEAVVAEVHDVFSGLPVDEFPLLRALAGSMTTGSGDERFAFGVDLLVSGLRAMAEPAG